MSDHEPPAADLSKMIWFYPEWIEALGPLNEKNALAYFQQSPYYDKQCSNEILKMQRMHTIQRQEEGDEEEDLKKFTGVEFALVHARSPPSLFIIHKRERFSPTEASPIAAYFIVNNSIYQAQDLHSLLSSRLTVAVTSIQSSLQLLHSTLTTASPFNPRSESQFVLSKTTAPTLLPAPSEPSASQPHTTGAADSPAPGPSTPSGNPTSQPKRPSSDSNPTQSQSLLLSLRTTLSSLPLLLASSSTAPAPAPNLNPSSSSQYGHGSLGGRTPSYIGGGTPSAGTPSFLNSYTDSRRNTPASTGGPGGMVPTPPNSTKNRGSPEEGGGGGGGGGGKKKRRKTATAQGGGGGTGGGQGGSQAGTPAGGS